jgi:hypothetical protein
MPVEHRARFDMLVATVVIVVAAGVLTQDLEVGYAAEAVVPICPARVLVPASKSE